MQAKMISFRSVLDHGREDRCRAPMVFAHRQCRSKIHATDQMRVRIKLLLQILIEYRNGFTILPVVEMAKRPVEQRLRRAGGVDVLQDANGLFYRTILLQQHGVFDQFLFRRRDFQFLCFTVNDGRKYLQTKNNEIAAAAKICDGLSPLPLELDGLQLLKILDDQMNLAGANSGITGIDKRAVFHGFFSARQRAGLMFARLTLKQSGTNPYSH